MFENEIVQKILIVAGIALGYMILYTILKKISTKATTVSNNISKSFNFKIIQTVLGIAAVIAIMLQFEATKEIYFSVLTNMSLIVVVLGFIVQESLKNILSGIIIAKTKPFDIGQRIIIEEKNITGTVEEITLQYTVIKKANNATAIVPNSVMNSAIIENSTYNGENAIANFLDIQVSYDSDIDKALEIINTAVTEHPFFIKEKECNSLIRNLGTDGYEARAIVWTTTVSENFQACSDIRVKIKKEFDKNNISIPYTTITTIQST